MIGYPLRRRLRRVLIALPQPRWLYALCRFYCNTVDGEGFADMTINGELDFLRSVAPECQIVVDGGAHRGDWTAHVLALRETAEIHCFEPEPEAYRVLAARSFPERVVRNRLALSSRAGRRQIYLDTGSFYPKPRLGPAGPETPERTATVEAVALDDYCEACSIRVVDLLKLDLEGHELEALRGASRLLASGGLRRVQFEVGPYHIFSRTLFKDFYELFHGHGYQVFKIVPRRLVPVDPYDERLENFGYKNFVAVSTSSQKIPIATGPDPLR